MSEDARRDQIVAAVRVAMNHFGVKRVTVSDVALEAGISRQTVYEYFPNREALVRAALEAGGWDLIAAGHERAAGSSEPTQRLAAILAVMLEYFNSSPLWSTEAKRAELAPHVTYGGGAFAGAATGALAELVGQWWPDANPGRVNRVADTIVRTFISHGLAPEESPAQVVATEVAQMAADALTHS